jgi:hypothetical protein
VDEELRVYDCDTLEALRAIRMPAPCSCLIRLDGGELAAFCGLEVFRVRPDTGGAERMASLPGLLEPRRSAETA